MNKDFLWGGAISACQAEGAYNINGKGLSIMDVVTGGNIDNPRRVHSVIKDKEYYPNHTAIDFYNHFEEDIQLLKEMGLKCFRTSISWTRIFPNGDEEEPNELGLAYYDKLFWSLRENGMEPIITLSHFDLPLNLVKKYGGWRSRKLISFYVRLAETVFKRYKGIVKYWLTFNEINTTIKVPILAGVIPDPDEEKVKVAYQALHHQFVASAKAVKLAKEIDPENKVGCMLMTTVGYPKTTNPKDVLAAQEYLRDGILFFSDVQVRGYYPSYFFSYDVQLDVFDEDTIDLEQGKVDFIAFSYYSSQVVSQSNEGEQVNGNIVKGLKNEYLEVNEWGWQIDPEGLKFIMRVLYERYNVPLFIVENGLGFNDIKNELNEIHDDYRISYLRDHIRAFLDVVKNEKIELMGYTMWSPIDIVSGGTGEMKKRYGLIYVDKDDFGNGDMQRYKKMSFYWYKKVIESNGGDL